MHVEVSAMDVCPGPFCTSSADELLPIRACTTCPFKSGVEGSAVLLMIRMGLFSVLLNGPAKRSGGATGQYSQPSSGSRVVPAREKRDRFTKLKRASSITSSADGGEKGATSLQVTAERSRSTRPLVFTVSSITEPSPDIAAESA